jgi:hypothetical protein
MSARLGALRNENVRSGRNSVFCKSNRLDLTDDGRTRAMDPLDEGAGIAEREHDRDRLALQRHVEQLRLHCHAPRNEADPEARLQAGEMIELLREPLSLSVSAAQDAQASRGTHRRSQAGVSHLVHRREQYRVGDSESFRQCGPNRHAVPLSMRHLRSLPRSR